MKDNNLEIGKNLCFVALNIVSKVTNAIVSASYDIEGQTSQKTIFREYLGSYCLNDIFTYHQSCRV